MAMSTRLRIYHPEYRPSWLERAMDLFSGTVVEPRPDGADYSLVARREREIARTFLEGTFALGLVGREIVRADSHWQMPDFEDARRAAGEALVTRLRFGQEQASGLRLPLAARWIELVDVPHGTRLLIRLLDPPNQGLRSYLAGNLAEGKDGWTEFAVVAD